MTDATTMVTLALDIRAADAVTAAQTGTVTATMPVDVATTAGVVLLNEDPVIATCTAGTWSALELPTSAGSDETPSGWTWHFVIETDVGGATFDAIVPVSPASTSLAAIMSAALPAGTPGASFIPLTQKGAHNGVASLDSTGKVPTAQLPGSATGVTSVTATDATIVMGGTATAPTVGVGAVPQSKVTGLAASLSGLAPTSRALTAGTGLTGGGDLTADRSFAVTYGTTAGTSAQGNDSRLSDSRTPTAHATTHHTGGSDALAPSDIGAVPVARLTTAGTGLTGGGDMSADRTLAVSYGSTAGTAAQGNDSRLAPARFAPVTLTDASGTLSGSVAGTDVVQATLAGNRTLSSLTGAGSFQRVLLVIRQPATGGPFTLTAGGGYAFGGALSSLTLSTAANALDMFVLVWDDDNSRWLVTGFSGGF